MHGGPRCTGVGVGEFIGVPLRLHSHVRGSLGRRSRFSPIQQSPPVPSPTGYSSNAALRIKKVQGRDVSTDETPLLSAGEGGWFIVVETLNLLLLTGYCKVTLGARNLPSSQTQQRD